MDQSTLNLITFIESLVGLAASTVTDLKNTISGASSKTTDQILADADTTYQGIIAAAKQQ